MATVTTAKNAECARTVLSMYVSAVEAVLNVRQYAPIVTKSVRTALTKKSVADVTYVKTVQAETETSAITARHVRCAQNMFASAEAVALNVRQCALNAMKNVQNVLTKKFAVDVIYVKTAPVETETSAITARHVRCAQNMFASAVEAAPNVQLYALNVTKNAANVLMISARTAEFVRSAVMPRDSALTAAFAETVL